MDFSPHFLLLRIASVQWMFCVLFEFIFLWLVFPRSFLTDLNLATVLYTYAFHVSHILLYILSL